MFGWFFERRKFLWPRGLSSASRIEKRLSPRLPFPPLSILIRPLSRVLLAAWQPDGEARTLMIFFVARRSLRKLGRALQSFCIPSSSRSLSLVVKFDDLGTEGDFFLSLREHISLLLFFPCSQRIVSSDSVPPSGWELIKEPSSSSDARVFQAGSRKVSSLKLRTIPSLVSKLLIDLETQRQIRE